MHPDWPRSLRDQCQAAGVPFFFKQWGEWVSVSEVECPGGHRHFLDGATVRRAGKKLAGCLLDGREWKEFPEVNE
jgi:protein gp37